MTGNDNVLKLECEKKDISVCELCIQMLNVLINLLRKEKDEIPPSIKFPIIDILMSIIVDRGYRLYFLHKTNHHNHYKLFPVTIK